MLHTILRLPAAKSQSGCSRSTIYLRISQGLWTKQISLCARAIGWPANEIAEESRCLRSWVAPFARKLVSARRCRSGPQRKRRS